MIIIVMGVSGSGKSTIGRALAQRLGRPFYDGDDFHPPENVEKMSKGLPLDDRDPLPWLVRLQDLIQDHGHRGETAVLACSALKKRYRDQLRSGADEVRFVYLQGDFDLIWKRMRARSDHYMKSDMLQTQFEALEIPSPDEALIVDIELGIDQIADGVLEQLMRESAGRNGES